MTDLPSINDFAERLARGDLPVGEYAVALEFSDFRLPVRVISRSPSNGIVCFGFHGAVNQQQRKIPVFFGSHLVADRPEATTFISFADPGLRLAPEVLYTWYAGDHGFPAQRAIGELCQAVVKAARPTKTIFVGGSTGAHPALLHSHAIEGSVCLVVNPLASVSAYPTNLQRYLDLCWPGETAATVIGSRVQDDVFARYAKGYRNKVVVLQNARDPYLKALVLPLVQGLVQHAGGSLFLNEFFAEHDGHNYPPEPLKDWFGAVVGIAGTDLNAFAAMATRRRAIAPAPAARAPGHDAAKAPDPALVKLADRIALDLV
jgi:hypothetical protein